MASPDLAPPAGRPRSLAKRAAILAAATDAFLESGFTGASMDAVALAAGVSKQTVYGHFGSKEALFVEVVTAMTTAGGDHVGHDAPLPAEGLEAGLVSLLGHQLDVVLDPTLVRLRRLVIGEFERFPDLGRAVFDAGPQRAIDGLTARLRALDADGRLHVPDPAAAAEHLNWLVMATPIERVMLRGEVPGPDWRHQHVAEGVRIFLAAFAPR